MFLLVLLLSSVAQCALGSEELNVTEIISDSPTESPQSVDVTESLPSDGSRVSDGTQNGTAAIQDTPSARPAPPRQPTRAPRLVRRRPRRARRFRPGNGPRFRDTPPYNPVNVYNPYYRVPQTYYDAYYNPYQGYYPEYAQTGYYPAYPYQPQQPYPQPYPHPPPPPVIPTPPPTLAPIPDLYYVQNTDGHYQYRRVSVTRRSDAPWSHYSQDRRSSPDYRYPRRPARLPTEFRPPRLTSAPYKARVFGLGSDLPPIDPTETSGG
ncbi:uncharacterized protein LOC128986841 [Macrosteles quadrilineatus]|uniref:uncharacterized protein LOC128986841 n=1 Tax=Macrosteles quadrilineatus TaxID=74068 RepID=UPI0023E24986|nr:uncharacterized protein LOC128986841 [Macrosteles quadrilineatus]